MCPVCISTAAAVALGTGALGGLAGLLFGKRPAQSSTKQTSTQEN